MSSTRKRRCGLWLCVVVGLASLAQAGVVLADGAPTPTPAPGASYEETIRHAVEEYSLGHWPEARFFFARAHALSPNARTLRGLGLTCYESRNYVDAIAYFKDALANTAQPLTEAMRAEVTQLMQQSEQFVTRLVLTVEPTSAVLELDHGSLELPSDGVVMLDPGEHELVATAEGHLPERRVFNAEGHEMRVELHLRATPGEPVAAAPASTPAPAAAMSADSRSGLAPYLVIGAGGAALIVGGVLVAIATSDKYAVEHAPKGTLWRTIESRYNRGRIFFPVGFALMGVGLAGAAVGLTWKLWPSEERDSAPRAQLRLSPTSLELSGTF
jgi:tetratricopeptide (TPR) repeat protein